MANIAIRAHGELMTASTLWNRFKNYYFEDPATGFAIDVSRIKFPEDLITDERMKDAFKDMDALVKGKIANPDEKRMVGHYWLRDASLAPDASISKEIKTTLERIKTFAKKVHRGEISGKGGKVITDALIIGIGGSALGPQFVNQALGTASDPIRLWFFDNTDPDGMAKVLEGIPDLATTLCVVISKSGGTKETRNGQIVAKDAFARDGIEFAKHFVAITGEGSELFKTAKKEEWLDIFPMWDWVGGRTSELSAVGLLPAALQGVDIASFLDGAKHMDALTIRKHTKRNPAALLALMWYQVGSGKGLKDMVVLPYKDRLELFSRYLQQLVMESLGKELDLKGAKVNQGIAVYGNKGSTDQHAYVQQLRDGLNNFFVTFIEVLKDRSPLGTEFGPSALEVEPGVTCGDYLSGFFLGTRNALYESDRESITLTVNEVSPFTIGMLIALFERAVGFYASLVNINAYHQPGVEAGKKAAAAVLALQDRVVGYLRKEKGEKTVDQIAGAIGDKDSAESIFKVLRHLASNGRVNCVNGPSPFEDTYSI